MLFLHWAISQRGKSRGRHSFMCHLKNKRQLGIVANSTPKLSLWFPPKKSWPLKPKSFIMKGYVSLPCGFQARCTPLLNTPMLSGQFYLMKAVWSWDWNLEALGKYWPSWDWGVNCEGERSFNTEAMFPIRAISLLVQEARAWFLSPQVAGTSAFHLRNEFAISSCISKGIWKILCLSAGISSPSLRLELNSCYIKGKDPAPEAEKRKMLQADLSKRQLMI